MIEFFQQKLPSIKICQFYNLLEYDSNMGRLYHDLKKYIDTRFTDNINFADNERIVFLHGDHDFYIDSNTPGFTLYNLQLILRELKIPNYFCRIITHLPNYQKYTKMVQESISNDCIPIKSVTSSYFKCIDIPISDIDINYTKIARLFTVGSRLSRFHRTYFMSQLFNNKLENCGFVNYYNISDDNKIINNGVNNVYNTPCYFLYSVPFTRSYPELIIKDDQNRECVRKFQLTTPNYTNCKQLDIINNKDSSVKYHWTELQNSLIYVGLEAIINCPEPYNDEIGFKSMSVKRPFILFGTPNLLYYLKSLGFKTFDSFWDEGYDKIIDFEDRVNAIMLLLKQLSNRSINDLQQMAIDMQEILEHNFNHLKNTFTQQELNKIIAGITE